MIASIYYERLAESLEKKYTDKSLTEAWADTMPNWMKNRLGKIAKNSRYISDQKIISYPKYKDIYETTFANFKSQGYSDENARNKAFDKARRQWNDDNTAGYIPTSGTRGLSWSDANRATAPLYQQFVDNIGTDLQNVTFVESEPPKSQKHISFQNGNIPIWHIKSTDQVYAKGLNDYEELQDNSSSFYGKAFKYIPLKTLNELCDGDFCYIEGSSIQDTTTYANKQQERKERHAWSAEDPNKLIQRHEGDSIYVTSGDFSGYAKLDKSGYPIVPSAKKYAKILERSRAKNYARVLQKLEDRLRAVYSVLRNAASLGTWKRPVNSQQLYNYYNSALNEYKSLLQDIESVSRESGVDSETFLDYLTSTGRTYFGNVYTSGFKRQCNDVDYYLKYAERDAKQFETSVLDI